MEEIPKLTISADDLDEITKLVPSLWNPINRTNEDLHECAERYIYFLQKPETALVLNIVKHIFDYRKADTFDQARNLLENLLVAANPDIDNYLINRSVLQLNENYQWETQSYFKEYKTGAYAVLFAKFKRDQPRLNDDDTNMFIKLAELDILNGAQSVKIIQDVFVYSGRREILVVYL